MDSNIPSETIGEGNVEHASVNSVFYCLVLSAATAVASSRNAISPSLAGLCLTWSLVYFSQVSAQLNSHMIFDEWIKD